MKVGDKKKIKLNSGKEAYLIVLNMNPLVIGWESEFAPKASWNNKKEAIEKWYEEEFPYNLKDLFKLENLHPLTFENLATELPYWIKPINSSYSFKLDYFPDVPWNKDCEERKYYNDYWLENKSSYSNNGCSVRGDGGYVFNNYFNIAYFVRPDFHINP